MGRGVTGQPLVCQAERGGRKVLLWSRASQTPVGTLCMQVAIRKGGGGA